ncbi:phospholipase A2 inhibitor and Ly6/PLAUR domain-containing protein-like [Anomaloglossus baeobatrachus]|uniref:phospholipase A2 inhibitor and Ly6/PLAUR domain-containing protein-like n=1 Tax=Anomaloglossus baeobatrachus TaxID=238106 RepID=UPI003F4FB3B0
MKPVIISIFLLCLSLHIAAALKCYHCHQRDSDTCEQKEIECPEGDTCLTICEEYKNNKTYHSLYKGCNSNMPCGVTPYGRATDQLHLLVNTKCCNTSLCNDKMYEMPEEEEPNGVVCPSCYDNTLKECRVDSMIMCKGKDDKCITIACTVENPDGSRGNYSAKGCMSALGCEMDLSQLIGVKILHQEFSYCTDPPEVLSEEENEESEGSDD